MKCKHLILLLCLSVALSAVAQNRIPGTPVSITLPTDQWKYLQTIDVDQNTRVYLYSFKAYNVIDRTGDTVLPYVSIYVHKNYPKTIYDLVLQRYEKRPYQSLSEQIEGLPFSEAISYVGALTDGGKDYEFRMLYFKHQGTAYEIRLETTADTFEDFDAAFQAILNSVSAEK